MFVFKNNHAVGQSQSNDLAAVNKQDVFVKDLKHFAPHNQSEPVGYFQVKPQTTNVFLFPCPVVNVVRQQSEKTKDKKLKFDSEEKITLEGKQKK